MEILNHEFVYDSVFHFVCLKNCIRQILNYYGVQNSLLYVNCVPDITYEGHIASNSEYIVAYQSNLAPILPNYINRLKHFTYNKSDNHKAWDDVLLRINSGYPIIAMADTYELKYREKDYHKNHGSHAIIVHGYDPFYEEVKIIDWYEPFFFKGKISKEEYIRSRNSTNSYSNNPFSGHSLENEWFYLSKHGWIEDSGKLLDESIKLYLSYNSDFPFKTEKENTYVGVKALKILFEKLSSVDSPSKNIVEDFYNNIYCEYKAKHLFLHYLKSYNEENNTKILENVISILKELCIKWDAATTLLLKTMVTNSMTIFEKSKVKLNEIIKQEYHLLNAITEAYDCMLSDF